MVDFNLHIELHSKNDNLHNASNFRVCQWEAVPTGALPETPPGASQRGTVPSLAHKLPSHIIANEQEEKACNALTECSNTKTWITRKTI